MTQLYPSAYRLSLALSARQLLAGLKYFVLRLTTIWADAAYRGNELVGWCKAEDEWDLDVVERMPGARGFAVVPKRWIVEKERHARRNAQDRLEAYAMRDLSQFSHCRLFG